MESKNTKFNLAFIISNAIGQSFYRLGYFVSSNPWSTIFGSWIVVAVCAMGFLRFHNEKSPMNLWIPKGSRFYHDTEWLTSRFEEGTRTQNILVTAKDVLDRDVLIKVLKIHDEISKFTIKGNNMQIQDFNDLCFKIPIILGFSHFRKRRKRNISYESNTNNHTERNSVRNRPFSPSVDMDPKMFCDIVDQLPQGCMLESLLELWRFDIRKLNQTTKDDIIRTLNKTRISPYSGHQVNYNHLLGETKQDQHGQIISASSLLSQYMLYVNFSESDINKLGNLAGTEDWVSENTMLWENRFIKTMEKLKRDLEDDNFKIYYSAGRSYGDISSETMFADIDKLILGILLMSLYMQLVLSKFGWTEIRLSLGSLGLLSICMAFISGAGICSMVGIAYGPVHTSLPFLLMGLGVDDMFVMMAVYRKLQAVTSNKSPQERIGLMLQHAGASITVTSITDIVAFIVGSITVLPSLQSFCLYAAVSVFMTYGFVITFYVAIFTLDERRISQKRNSFVPCIVHKSEKTIWIDKHLMDRFLNHFYSKFILTIPGKIIVILSVICVTSFNIIHLLSLRQKFDPIWFIPENTYLGNYYTYSRQLYPDIGSEAMVLMGKINYTTDMQKIINLYESIQNQTDIVYGVHGWPITFQDFVKRNHEKDVRNISDTEWRLYLSQFLFSNQGGKFQSDFKFEKKPKCGEATSDVKVSQISFKFKKFYEREDYLPAKHRIENLVHDAHLNSGEGFSTVWGRIFGNWVTDEIIDVEIYRNIGLAMIGVMICTAVIIVNLQVCLWIFVTVLLTLVNVGGSMESLGMTLDIVSCIALQLSVGLCVDYAAHIGHTFLTISEGNRTERALETVKHIGAAVIYGGTSTILALVVLYGSQAYTYRSFFRIFFLVVLYGLFHGIVLLPVILSIVGPKPYKKLEKNYNDNTSNATGKENELENLSFIKNSDLANHQM